MESLTHHSWRKYLWTGEHHQVMDPLHVTDTGMVWAACAAGGVRDLWAVDSDPEGEPRCVHCLVLVGGTATARRAHRIAQTQSQAQAAFRALNVDGPVIRAWSERTDGPAELEQ